MEGERPRPIRLSGGIFVQPPAVAGAVRVRLLPAVQGSRRHGVGHELGQGGDILWQRQGEGGTQIDGVLPDRVDLAPSLNREHGGTVR